MKKEVTRILTDTQKLLIENYEVLTFAELCKLINASVGTTRAYLSVLSRWALIDTNKAKKDNDTEKIVELMDKKVGNSKGNARNYIERAILLSGVLSGKILSLPCVEWFIEKSLLEDVSDEFKILGAEIDNNVYRRSGMTLFNSPLLSKCCSLINTKIGELICKGVENEFAHLILDYCGGFSKFANEIKFAMTNKIVEVNGTISMTFSARALGDYGRLILATYGITECDNKNETAMRLFVDSINILSDAQYKVETIFPYRDTETMILVIVKRIK